MQQKIFPLQNRGMNRDTSVSKAENSSAYDNRNIRVTVDKQDTLLSVTNERGNREVTFDAGSIQGKVIGWNVLNNHVILFTTTSPAGYYSDNEKSSTSYSYGATFYAIPGDGWRTYILTLSGKDSAGNDTLSDEFIVSVPSNRKLPVETAVANLTSQLASAGIEAQMLVMVYGGVAYPSIQFTKASYRTYQKATLKAQVLPTSPVAMEEVSLEELPRRKEYVEDYVDRIYRIDYEGDKFVIKYGNTDAGAEEGVTGKHIFEGKLRFDSLRPIESVVYHETDEIQKIYWVDGNNVLRFCNFMEPVSSVAQWGKSKDSRGFCTCFDSNKPASLGLEVSISKDNSGNSRANGVVQYLVTYFNKHGQETGYVWVSDLVYLSPMDSGGSPEGQNSNSITLRLSGLDTSFGYYRVYSIERSSLNGTVSAFLIAENAVGDGSGIAVDNGSPLSAVDWSSLLYLGSQSAVPGTLAHKDQTLFLGDLSSVGRKSFSSIQSAVNALAFEDENGVQTPRSGDNVWLSHIVSFKLTDADVTEGDEASIPYVENSGAYPYSNQLKHTSSQITGFKGGEKYRFGLMFRTRSGVSSDTFWIGDKVNVLYPVITEGANGPVIRRVIATCTVPEAIIDEAAKAGFSSVTLMVAEASYADRSVLAQGIVNPTMFNVWERYNGRIHSYASWLFRPRQSRFAWQHFSPVENSDSPGAEIQCNWWSTDDPTPYYRYFINDYTEGSGDDTVKHKRGDIVGGLDGIPDYDLLAIAYRVRRTSYGVVGNAYKGSVEIIKVNRNGVALDMFDGDLAQEIILAKSKIDASGTYTFTKDGTDYTIGVRIERKDFGKQGYNGPGVTSLWTRMRNYLAGEGINESYIATRAEIDTWTNDLPNNKSRWYAKPYVSGGNKREKDDDEAFSHAQWESFDFSVNGDDRDYIASYYKKHLMFVDENIVTLNSPELEQEAVSIDQSELNFRIVGVAKMTGNTTDYTLMASGAHLAGSNLQQMSFSHVNPSGSPDGLTAWPLYIENDLVETSDEDVTVPNDIENRRDEHYDWGGGLVAYWLYLWQKYGTIPDFVDNDGERYSDMQSKVIANLRFSHKTYFNQYDASTGKTNHVEFAPYMEKGSIRQFNYTHSQLVSMKAEEADKTYSANVEESLSVPGSVKYPVYFSDTGASDIDGTPSTSYQKVSNSPVTLAYRSSPHAVISLGYWRIMNDVFSPWPRLLPYVFDVEDESGMQVGDKFMMRSAGEYDGNVSGTYIPWNNDGQLYSAHQLQFVPDGSWKDELSVDDRYLFIGELYRDHSENDYGGHSESAVAANRFVTAGPSYEIAESDYVESDLEIIGNQGDTYFQRWDCLKTLPSSENAKNGVVDIASFMVETHINLDGRYDKQRGTSLLASLNTEEFGSVNPVYSQGNNFYSSMDRDSDADMDVYRSSVTWSLEKHDSAMVDEWSHVTLASSLRLDGDKGICRAIRRFGNSLIAFQDRGIAEILFNSRTQLSTNDGVPVEIANSGKVDGKRYLTGKYGCINKWSIMEGKAGLYFVDNINKMFGRVADGVEDLSTKLGFSAWFRKVNSTDSWDPYSFGNFVSYYDRVHSDVYLIRNAEEGHDDDAPCIVYNEQLGVFTSFYDYDQVTMMANVGDRFVSLHGYGTSYDGIGQTATKMWLQNEGLYCNFFGEQYNFHTTYRVTPDPYGDKIWTNIEYRSDFFEVLDSDGSETDSFREALVSGNQLSDRYVPDMTFDALKVWNEYQTTNEFTISHNVRDGYADVRKKFRIWRMDIPRAVVHDGNRFGLDRIRNPWVFIKFTKDLVSEHSSDDSVNRCVMQMHDALVKYFE